MLTYFKEAEKNPAILKKKLLYSDTNNQLFSQNIHPQKDLEYGKFYTIDELIKRMIIYSDNKASTLLLENVSLVAYNKTFSDIGIPPIKNHYTLSVGQIAKVFISLNNATYLNKELSQKAINLLKQSTYNDGLTAGIPRSIQVAHKFGERRIRSENVNQFHECGIVYVPGKPYVLCVLTDGKDIYKQAKFVKEVSEITYNSIAKPFIIF